MTLRVQATTGPLVLMPLLEIAFPDVENAPEQFLEYCLNLLRGGLNPNQSIHQGDSLVKRIFFHVAERRFDDHLMLLSQVVRELAGRHADFKEDTGDVLNGLKCFDFTCQQVAYLYWATLTNENHPQKELAQTIMQLTGEIEDIDACLITGRTRRAADLIRRTTPSPNLIGEVFKNYIGSGFYEETKVTHLVPDLVKALLENGGNPNCRFDKIEIKTKGTYRKATCLHVAYLAWRSLKSRGKKAEAKSLKQVFLMLLKDPRIDIRAACTEEYLDKGGGHFSEFGPSLAYYKGENLEKANIGHLAAVEKDLKTLKKVLTLAPDLINSKCFVTEGKFLLTFFQWRWRAFTSIRVYTKPFYKEPYSFYVDSDRLHPEPKAMEWFSDTSNVGFLTNVFWDEDERHEPKSLVSVTRYSGISLMHLAARNLDDITSAFLASIGGMAEVEQTEVMKYQEHSLECLSHGKREKIEKKFGKIVKICMPLRPTLPTAFYTLHQNGYDVIYNPATKIPLVRHLLHKEELAANTDKNRYKEYRQNPQVPRLNSASTDDFVAQDLSRGHAKPRADAYASSEALYDVGYLTNILAQDKILNNGLWKKLETQIRELTNTYTCLEVFTGGVFTTDIDVKGPKEVTHRIIGDGEVSVPTHLFKVVYAYHITRGWFPLGAVLIPNKPLNYHEDLTPYKTTVERIQELSGIDFAGYLRDKNDEWRSNK